MCTCMCMCVVHVHVHVHVRVHVHVHVHVRVRVHVHVRVHVRGACARVRACARAWCMQSMQHATGSIASRGTPHAAQDGTVQRVV